MARKSRVELSAQLLLDMIAPGKRLTITRIESESSHPAFGDRVAFEFEHDHAEIPEGDVSIRMRQVTGGQAGPVTLLDGFDPVNPARPAALITTHPTDPQAIAKALRDHVENMGMGGRGSGKTTRSIAYALAEAIEDGEPVVYSCADGTSYYSDRARGLVGDVGDQPEVFVPHHVSLSTLAPANPNATVTIAPHEIDIGEEPAVIDITVVDTGRRFMSPALEAAAGAMKKKISEHVRDVLTNGGGRGFGAYEAPADQAPTAKPAPIVPTAAPGDGVHSAMAAHLNRKERP